MVRSIVNYGAQSVIPIAPARDAFTARDVVMLTWWESGTQTPGGYWLSRTYRGDGAYLAACQQAECLQGRI